MVYVLNRDAAANLTISSPLEAHKSHTLAFSVAGLDMGFDNPVFAAIELDYAEADQARLPLRAPRPDPVRGRRVGAAARARPACPRRLRARSPDARAALRAASRRARRAGRRPRRARARRRAPRARGLSRVALRVPLFYPFFSCFSFNSFGREKL